MLQYSITPFQTSSSSKITKQKMTTGKTLLIRFFYSFTPNFIFLRNTHTKKEANHTVRFSHNIE